MILSGMIRLALSVLVALLRDSFIILSSKEKAQPFNPLAITISLSFSIAICDSRNRIWQRSTKPGG
jgi:hypothetical protein